MKKKRTSHKRLDESTANIQGNPKSAYGMLNKYGTYEIQPTADTDNAFPAISQGLAKSRQAQPHKKHNLKNKGDSN